MSNIKKIAVIVPRYGKSLGGGAETLLKSLVDHSFVKFKNTEVEVWTTCAKDHRTWENYYDQGIEYLDDIKVIRFPVEDRNLDVFIKSEQALQSGRALSLNEQFEWLKSGVNSKGLYQHIATQCSNFDLLIFGPYLFPITYWGALICPEKSILLPCLHDEAYAYLDCFRELFKKVKGVFFNSLPEKVLADKIYNIENFDNKSFEVGMGFEQLENIKIDHKENYLLYSGRKEQGKGLDYLLECYETLPLELRKDRLNLYLIGSGSIEFRKELPVGVVDFGFVSEEKKYELMSNALALVQPSLNESFSIVLMESWLLETPVLVRQECSVTKHHVEVSKGGMCFSDLESFKNCIDILLSDNNISIELAKNGKSFVQNYYSWNAVNKRLENSLRSLGF